MRAPGSKRSPLPTTSPTIWCPGIRGSFGCGSSPSTMWRSVRQTPQARTRISTCPGSGAGSGSSATRSGVPAASSTIARMERSLPGRRLAAPMAHPELSYRRLDAGELGRVAEIDRSERIDAIYVQRGSALDVVDGDFSSPPWDARGDGEHSVAGVRRALEAWCSAGGMPLGGFDGERLVALAVV